MIRPRTKNMLGRGIGAMIGSIAGPNATSNKEKPVECSPSLASGLVHRYSKGERVKATKIICSQAPRVLSMLSRRHLNPDGRSGTNS